MSTATSTGNCINDLMARADNVLAIYGTHQSSVDFPVKRWAILSAVFRRLNDWKQIVALQDHLAVTMFTADGEPVDDYQDRVHLYHDLADIQECLGKEQRDLCKLCKCMEGLHSTSFKMCPVQPGLENGPVLLSNTFTR